MFITYKLGIFGVLVAVR